MFPKPQLLRPAASALARTATTLGVNISKPTPVVPTKYGGVYSVTLIPGDGVGKEITQSVEEIFEHANVPVEFEKFNVSGDTTEDAALFKRSMDSLRRNKVGLKGILYTPVERSGHTSWNVAMRQQLDIYASVVLCKSVPGFPTRHRDVDFAIIRENTEGEYSGLEHQSSPGVVESLKIMTRHKTERIARFAFDFAIKNGRKHVTAVHKANIMKLGDGLFLNTCRRVAEEYKDSGITFSDMIVDNTSMQLVNRPQQFDVMVMPNLYGSIVSNIGAALVGGPGIVPGANIGREYALFEPGCRHVAKDIEGQDVANPSAMLLSAAMMLRHLGLDAHANNIAAATYGVIEAGKIRTPDMGGKNSTTDFTQAVMKALK
ncbi:mitochondrial NAD+-specific isocitrate dehydrogenase subunit 1 [Rhodotorula diobovata]|uniref:Isocitrate dehydrogenase [NAD] subunit 1, mitochondrial n=1 Tax=Rhodotorula diobovata TaxID=5288 RepID=A0A5C5FQP1_9BASI|nr:mitochondrial NAD+-specific isocitrate dehydrogenase subunit 1 [Rhodotorula diobovata]